MEIGIYSLQKHLNLSENPYVILLRTQPCCNETGAKMRADRTYAP